MKPLHIVVLVAAGALGGALIMKMAQQPHAKAPAPVFSQLRTPPAPAPITPPLSTPATPPPALADAEVPAVLSNPSPFESPKLERHAPKRQITQRPAMNQPPPATVHPGAPAAKSPQSAPVAPGPVEPMPQPIPPARNEPENQTPPPPPAPPEAHRVTLNAGTLLPVRLVDGLTSERNLPGDSFTASLDKELVVDGFVIAERGARVEGRVVSSDKGGRVKGVSSLAVELVRLRTSDGQTVAIQTDGFERQADESRRQDAEKIGGGALLGAVIGAIAGGGKGAAIGAGVGGGAGAGTVMATRGNAAKLPSETRVTFRLRAPVTLTEKLRP